MNRDHTNDDAYRSQAEASLASLGTASGAGRALYTGFMALTGFILVSLATTDDLQLFDRAPLKLPLLNVDISLSGFYQFTPWLYVIIHANLLLVFSIIAEKHRYFASLLDDCAFADRQHLRQQLHVNAFTQFLGADHRGGLAIMLKLLIWITIGLMPPLILLSIQLDFLAAQIENVTSWQQWAVLVDCVLVAYFWNNILQKQRRARFPKDWNPPLFKRYVLTGWVLSVCAALIFCFSWLVALVPLSEEERRVHNGWYMPSVFSGDKCVLNSEMIDKEAEFENSESEVLETEIITLKNKRLAEQVAATKSARQWQQPYRCSNRLSWWFLDREDAWLNNDVGVRRWLNLPDQVLVANRATAQPQWLNRLRHELQQEETTKAPDNIVNNNDGVEEPEQEYSNTDTEDTSPDSRPSTPVFNTLDYFLPVNKELQNFRFANFRRSFLPNAKLRGADLRGTDLFDASLQGTNLWEAKLQGANLGGVKLQGAELTFTQLQGAYLRKANLQDAVLRWAKLQRMNLRSARLQGANLWKTNLQSADLSSANLQGAVLRKTELQGVALLDAKLQGTVLRNAELQGALCGRCDLTASNLNKSSLDKALILSPGTGWDQHKLILELKAAVEQTRDTYAQQRLNSTIQRLAQINKDSVTDFKGAELASMQDRCLILTARPERIKNTAAVCDQVEDLRIDPLQHLLRWASYNAELSCEYGLFDRYYNPELNSDEAYEIIEDYRSTETPTNEQENKASDALIDLALALYDQQLLRKVENTELECVRRTELDDWYQDSLYADNEKLKDRILNLKLEPFATTSTAKPNSTPSQ